MRVYRNCQEFLALMGGCVQLLSLMFWVRHKQGQRNFGTNFKTGFRAQEKRLVCWNMPFYKEVLTNMFVATPRGAVIGVWQRNWPLLGIFPGPSMSSYLGESSLTALLASRICICKSSFPKDDVMGFQRLSRDHIGLGSATVCERTCAVRAFLDNSECVTSDCPLASCELTKVTSRRQGASWRDSVT